MKKRAGLWILGCVLTAAGVAGTESAPSAASSPQAQAAVAAFMQGPSVFIENAGQWGAPEIRFALDGQGANVGLTDRGPKFQLFRELPRPAEAAAQVADPADPARAGDRAPAPREMHAFGLLFDGAAAVSPEGRGLSERTYNYNVGPVEQHRSGVRSFESVWYSSVWPGVDLEVTGRRTGVKYTFHVAPGADWRSVTLRYDGIQGLSLRADGGLEIRVKEGWEPLVDAAPLVYQEVDGEKRPVAGAFRLVDDHAYGFDVTGAYDPARPLVIDPDIAWGVGPGGDSPPRAAWGQAAGMAFGGPTDGR